MSVAGRLQLVVTVGQQPTDRRVVLAGHHPQPPVTQRGDSGGRRVVGVVLRAATRAQHPHPGRQRGRDVHDVLTGGDELLRQQVTEPRGGLDRPAALVEAVGPTQQPFALLGVRPHLQSVQHRLVGVDRHRGVRRLVGVYPDQSHGSLLRNLSVRVEPRRALLMGTRALLFRATPQPDARRPVTSKGSQPLGRQAQREPEPSNTRTLREPSQRHPRL